VIRLDPAVHQFIDANAGELLLDHFASPPKRPLAAPFRLGWMAAQRWRGDSDHRIPPAHPSTPAANRGSLTT